MHMSPTLVNVMRHRPLPLAEPGAVAFPSEEVVCALVMGLQLNDRVPSCVLPLISAWCNYSDSMSSLVTTTSG